MQTNCGGTDGAGELIESVVCRSFVREKRRKCGYENLTRSDLVDAEGG